MKKSILFWMIPLSILAATPFVFNNKAPKEEIATRILEPIEGCVFMTVMGEQSSKDFSIYKNDENIVLSINDGLSWLSKSQLPNGGFGAGTHARQDITDPLAVKADPATTAMVAMALVRSGNTLKKGPYAKHLSKAVNYMLESIEASPKNRPFITDVRGTQIQTKLGENIDAVLAAQFLSNLLDRDFRGADKKRIIRALDICVAKIQEGTDAAGKQSGAGWAGVLQSGLANTALESAQAVGVNVDEEVLERAKNYQKDNFNANDSSVKTDEGAGIMLYAVSNSTRASAKDARKAKEIINKAKAEGKLAEDAPITADNLIIAGMLQGDAQGAATSYNVYESAKKVAQNDQVMSGFGNNGGEEFLSFLQTGESLIVNNDDGWKNWYDDMSGRILKIQNNDGSWNGHHCITSPVFCTATSLLLLTVENDIAFLSKVGE
jgi:hypothetical protein